MTLGITLRPTFSLALELGHTHYIWRAGPTPARSGPDLLPASHSAQRESAAVQMTFDIFGPNGSASSESAALQSSLVNRLRVRMASLGSTLFVLTWKVRVTPSRRSIYALRGRARRISGRGFSSWPTPTVVVASQNIDPGSWNGAYYLKPDGRKNQTDLQQAAMQTAWPTPMANKNTPQQREDFTPTLANVANWATPASLDWRDGSASEETMKGNSRPLNEQVVSGLISNGSPAGTEKPGQLNPAFSLWLMGLPDEWLNYAP